MKHPVCSPQFRSSASRLQLGRRLGVFAGILAIVVSGTSSAATLSEAAAAYGVYDVEKAETLYHEVLQSGSVEEQAVALRELGRIAWLVDNDRSAAGDLLAKSLLKDPTSCPSAHLYGRILNDGPTPAATRQTLAPLAQACIEVEPGVALEAVRTFLLQARAAEGRARAEIAQDGLKQLRSLPPMAQASAQGARLHLSLAIIAGDAKAAQEAWRAYFWLEKNHLALPVLKLTDDELADHFRSGLADAAPASATAALGEIFMRLGFQQGLVDLASRVGEDTSGRKEWADLRAYLAFHAKLSQTILTHDRGYARGKRNEEAYEASLSQILRETADELEPGATDYRDVLRRRFGVWGTEPGKSNGVSGIHLGHVAEDDWRTISQEGRTGEIRIIVLDNMIHNSFSAWLMDGLSAPGGWAVDGSTIVQVRPRYLLLIDEYARLATSAAARSRAMADIEEQRHADRLIAEAQPISFLPGVKQRLRLQAIEQLANKFGGESRHSAEFEIGFRRAYWSSLTASAIAAHEGRHILDQKSFAACPLADAELEFRAKLSEIRFSPLPRLALSSIYSGLFGGSSGHGIANKRLFTEYASWIEQHRDQVDRYEPQLSALEQLDRLTDDQIVAVAASLEPRDEGCARSDPVAKRSDKASTKAQSAV